MPITFLAPLFLAGAALLAAPYIIHQIRRPEREPLRFSSLLFIPNAPEEVIERRRVQHVLLMLLRMLIFLLLALAFSRPYWQTVSALDAGNVPARHLILVDTSYSMGANNGLDRAKAAARAALAKVPEGELVGVMTFAASPRPPLARVYSAADPDAGSKERARQAIDQIELTEEATAYLPALQFAQNELRAGLDEAAQLEEPLIIHLISDFQKTGMPERYTGWKLASNVTLDLVDVRGAPYENAAITEVALRRNEKAELRVLGKIKNWGNRDAEGLAVKLFVGGVETAANTITVQAGNASQTAFLLDHQGDAPIEGWLELAADALTVDNRRYFTWHPPRKKPVLIVADEGSPEQWPPAFFLAQALAPTADLPWSAETLARDALPEALSNPAKRPTVLILGDLAAFDEQTAKLVRNYVDQGGQLLVFLNESMLGSPLDTTLFGGLGIRTAGLRYQTPEARRYDLLTWVALDHPIFASFSGAKYNDFSALRFYNRVLMEHDVTNQNVRMIGQFDNDAPAVLEATVGDGRMIIWPFPLRLSWTNLPKNARFVPFLYETLAYLSDLREGATEWRVGERISVSSVVVDESGATVVLYPGEEQPVQLGSEQIRDPEFQVLRRSGFFRTRSPNDEGWRQVDAVNVDPRESDPTPVGPAELQLKLSSTPMIMENGKDLDGHSALDANTLARRREFGRNFLIAIFACLLLESWYMSRLTR